MISDKEKESSGDEGQLAQVLPTKPSRLMCILCLF